MTDLLTCMYTIIYYGANKVLNIVSLNSVKSWLFMSKYLDHSQVVLKALKESCVHVHNLLGDKSQSK